MKILIICLCVLAGSALADDLKIRITADNDGVVTTNVVNFNTNLSAKIVTACTGLFPGVSADVAIEGMVRDGLRKAIILDRQMKRNKRNEAQALQDQQADSSQELP